MAISFVRVDDRVIHGQLVTRWAKERPCDGIVAIDTDAAHDPLLSQVLTGSVSDIKVWLFDVDTAITKLPKVIASDKKYFVIAKSPETLQKLLEAGIDLSNDNNKINVGPMSSRKNTTTIAPNVCVSPQEVAAFNYLSQKGYIIDFRLVPDAKSYSWLDVQSKLS